MNDKRSAMKRSIKSSEYSNLVNKSQHSMSSPFPIQRDRRLNRIKAKKITTITSAKHKLRWLLSIISVALALGGGIIFFILYLHNTISVIDFKNWTIADSKIWAKENSINLRIDNQYNDKYETGKIFTQDIRKGARVKKGGFIDVFVSQGHDLTLEVPLPKIISMKKDDIDSWVANNFMTAVQIVAEFSDTVKAGNVISYEIKDDTVVDKVKRNTPIIIVVSKGKEDLASELVTVPDFRGKTLSDSNDLAKKTGIVLSINEQYDDTTPKDTVMAQSTDADELIKKGDTITIKVSKGQKIIIPSFSDTTKDTAAAMATKLNIPITVTTQYSNLPTDKLISQSIQAGTIYNDGDSVKLVYSLGNQVLVSSFVGQDLTAMQTWAKSLNDQGASVSLNIVYTINNAPQNKIISQGKTNTYVSINSIIKIIVSQGKAIHVPDFVAPVGSGYDVAITQEEAQAMCSQLNIVLVFVEAKKSGRLPGEVWYQSIVAGKQVAEGTTITLKYNPDNVTVKVPNFIGLTQDEIIAGGYNKKFDITFVQSSTYVDGYADEICQQSLSADTKVVAGSAITLTISPS